MTEPDHVILPMGESETQRFSPVETEMSEGVYRGWSFRNDRTKRLYVILGCVFAVLCLSTTILFGRVISIQTLVTINNEAKANIEEQISAVKDDVGEFKIVRWCPCGRILPANAISCGVPKEDEMCFGCYSNYDETGLQTNWPKTDYDPADNGVSVRSFIYQMTQHNLTDETFVTKCGWHKEGTAYYAYEQEEVDVRMCVIEELLNDMAEEKWFPYGQQTYYETPGYITFGRAKP